MFCKVTAVKHKLSDDLIGLSDSTLYDSKAGDSREVTMYVIKFAQEVCDRDATLN